jgi:hypothetical protein
MFTIAVRQKEESIQKLERKTELSREQPYVALRNYAGTRAPLAHEDSVAPCARPDVPNEGQMSFNLLNTIGLISIQDFD